MPALSDPEIKLKSRGPIAVTSALFPFLILLANFLIVRKLFVIEYTPYLMTTEGLFITLARGVAAHPWDLFWWPLWECGVPFQNAYAPLLGLLAGEFSRMTGASAALSIHQLSAAAFCLGPVFLYFMARIMTGRSAASFLAALAYSALSPCAWLVPVIRQDLGSVWSMRRLQILVFYGESPHTVSIALIPLAILCLYLGITRRPFWPGVGAGVAMGAAVLVNTFAAVIVGMAGLCLLVAVAAGRFGKYLGFLLVVGALTYAWISPLMPPSVIAAIRANSPTVDGDYRFTSRSLVGVLILAVGFAILCWALRKIASPQLQCFCLFAFLTGGVVLLGTLAQVYVVPQPHRYQIAMDMAICLSVVFSCAEFLAAKPRAARVVGVVAFVILGVAVRHDVRYARGLIKATDVTKTSIYNVAQWMNGHESGERVMLPGSYSFFFNNFSDVPQLLGGADPMLPNPMMRIIGYVLYSGISDQARDAQVSILWLKAFGAHAVVVPGPASSEYFKPFANPGKFEGVLPVLWREAGDTIYEIPAKSSSLAHVIPADAVVSHMPIHGLDVSETERYVKALDDPSLPEAALQWPNRHTATIDTEVQPGQAISVQVSYDPGWRAEANGSPLKVEKDGLGLIKLEPPCNGPCEVTLIYDGGTEWRLTSAASLIVMAGIICMAGSQLWKSRRV